MKVKIDAFEGPLDLLLHLIDKAEVDIYEVSVAEITDQYVEYIHQIQQFELEIASEFLVMAATLLWIKSKMLLPKKEEISLAEMLDYDGEELDPQQELILRLIEYKKFKGLAEQLRDKEAERSQVYTRPAEDLSIFIEKEEPNPVANVTLFDLLDAFQVLLQEKKDPKLRRVDRDEVSIDERMGQIIHMLSTREKTSFHQLFDGYITKDQIIVTFLAILELMKKKEIKCEQGSFFSEIWISRYAEEK